MHSENSISTNDLVKDPVSIPFRPLPKIMAPAAIERPNNREGLKVGDRVNIQITPANIFDKPFWRLFEVMLIDGERCRLTTPDKKFTTLSSTPLVKKLRDLQLQLQPGDKLRPGI